jgi:hypothetical protein
MVIPRGVGPEIGRSMERITKSAGVQACFEEKQGEIPVFSAVPVMVESRAFDNSTHSTRKQA